VEIGIWWRIKVLISRDVTFDETRMGMKCKDLETLVPETRVEETQFEAELPSEEEDDWKMKLQHRRQVELNQ